MEAHKEEIAKRVVTGKGNKLSAEELAAVAEMRKKEPEVSAFRCRSLSSHRERS